MLKAVNTIKYIVVSAVTAALAILIYSFYAVPNEMSAAPDSKINLNVMYSLSYTTTEMTEQEIERLGKEGSYQVNVRLFKSIPVKTVSMTVSKRRYVVVSGSIFGLRLFTRGVVIVNTNAVDTAQGAYNAAEAAGLKSGDLIISINNKTIKSCAEVAKIFSDYNGTPFNLTYERNGNSYTVPFAPVYSVSEKKYLAGIWIKDSAAGIGTMTYFIKENGAFASLGHGIYEGEANMVLPLSGGDIVHAQINGCLKSESGKAGELCGTFTSNSCGTICQNCETGLYGYLNVNDFSGTSMPVAMNSEVKVGKAQIISTVDKDGPKKYDIEIEKIDIKDGSNKNMTIKITDKALIEKTGGIVQGMSGSPIIQNGMFVGAVTYVLVNDPTHGYAILAQNMISASDQAQQSQLKSAS